MIDKSAVMAAKDHARREYPRESCGFIVGARYVPCENVHEEPEKSFRIQHMEYLSHLASGELRAVVHSHPAGPAHPTVEDQVAQQAMAVPWGIINVTKGQAFEDPFFFGDEAPIPPLIGRPFRHAVTDCYALVRDWFRLEYGITLKQYVRRDNWWDLGDNLLEGFFREAGFVEIEKIERIGDCVIGKVLSPVSNHCGVYVGDGLVLHHLSGRLSRAEPLGPWMKFVRHALRYRGLE